MGSNKVEIAKWSRKKKSDKDLMIRFLEEYNKADMVIGWNNNSFDNKLINARAMKYNLDVNTLVKSFDIMRQVKKAFRLPSYSMAYVSKYLGLQGKLSHSGIKMWEDIQWGNKVAYKQSMKLMVLYNIQDVALTEEIYFKLRKYLGNVLHAGALLEKKAIITCPNCGSKKVKVDHTTSTAAGTIQRVMVCKKDKVKFKVTNSKYLKTL
jgi:predicted PolB exonuclease-like 3'-5' exonuclease